MSDNWIHIIPGQPDLVPDEERQQRAVSYFGTIVAQTAEIQASVRDRIVFVDCGSSFESIACPSCGSDIDVDSWRGWMDEERSKRNSECF